MKFTASVLLRAITLFILLECMGRVERAAGASIGLFSTPDCSSCNLTIPSGESRNVYIHVVTTDLGYAVIGAEFKVVGLPPGWLVSTIPNPASSIVIGDPFGSVGTNIGFGTGQPGPCVNLFVATITATSQETQLAFQVTMKTPPSTQPCPLVVVDCPGCSTGICVSGGALLVNWSSDCSVAVQEGTWSGAKKTYR